MRMAIIGTDPDKILETAISTYLVGGNTLTIGYEPTTKAFIDAVTTDSYSEKPKYCMGVQLTKKGSQYMLYYSDSSISIGASAGFV